MRVVTMNVLVLRLLAFLVTFLDVYIAFPVQTRVEVQPEALFNGVSIDSIDGLGFDPWSPVQERVSVEISEASVTTTPDDTTPLNEDSDSDADKNVDPLSLVYYIGSFAALLLFFLVVSCSECCCEKNPSNANRNAAEGILDDCPPPGAGTPPPPYDDFAPPSYDSLYMCEENTKIHINVFVVPVHETHRVST